MTETLLAIVLFAITMTGTPGPNNIMIMTSGLNYGIRRSLPHFFGICIGTAVLVFSVGMGLGALFSEYAWLHTGVKILGVSYLLFLAWKIANAAAPVRPDADAEFVSLGTPLTFFQAVLFQWVNPKAWIISIGAIAAFTTGDQSLFLQVGVIATIMLVCAHPCVAMWLVFGYSLRNLLADPVKRRMFNWTMAVLLVASVITIV
ncbi:LysE family translocator [Allohahella sp. A8]|uniref:LysE family translocator n=1 Tax=Allohahella sp. A8 TaxID=3141461 RepID=UPI003A7FFA94